MFLDLEAVGPTTGRGSQDLNRRLRRHRECRQVAARGRQREAIHSPERGRFDLIQMSILRHEWAARQRTP